MWLIAGLGNPGKDYADTRHNIGFMVIDAMAAKFSIPLKQKKKSFIYGRGFIEEEEILLMKPLTFMNRSGAAVRDAFSKCGDIDNLLVVHDDIDMEKGVVRIRKNGTSGGHRGIESIIEILGRKDFLRVKIGIGRSERILPEDYVLTRFPKRERLMVRETVDKAVNAIETILTKGLSIAQNEFHRE